MSREYLPGGGGARCVENLSAGQRIGQGGVGACVLAEGYSSPVATLRLLAP